MKKNIIIIEFSTHKIHEKFYVGAEQPLGIPSSWSKTNRKVPYVYIKSPLVNSHAKWGPLGMLNGTKWGPFMFTWNSSTGPQATPRPAK